MQMGAKLKIWFIQRAASASNKLLPAEPSLDFIRWEQSADHHSHKCFPAPEMHNAHRQIEGHLTHEWDFNQ